MTVGSSEFSTATDPAFARSAAGVADALKRSGARYGFIEGFCGPGGMSLGLKQAGFAPLFAFDIDPRSVETHCGHLDCPCLPLDCREVSGQQLRRLAGLSEEEDLSLFAGGPPCQGFSKQKRGAHLGDDRNTLVLDFIRLVQELRPRYLFFENVAIFGQKRGRQYVDEMRNRLTNYSLCHTFVNSADFGLAQTRERFVVIGSREDQAEVRVPRRTCTQWRTVGDVIGDLPEPPLDYSVHPLFPNHQRAKVTKVNVDRFSHVPQGGGWQDIPPKLRLKCHQLVDTSRGGWPDVYGRLRHDGQCPTITGGFDSFTRGRFGHPTHDRPLTPREAARLQGFPDSVSFKGTRGDVRSQIGNAVPPPLAFGIGVALLGALLVTDGQLEDDAVGAESVPADLFSVRRVRA